MTGVLDAARVVGVHTTVQARDLSPRTGFDLALESLLGALDDAGIPIEELDGIVSNVNGWPQGASPGLQSSFWARQLGRPLAWIGGGFGIPAMLDAAGAIAAGRARTVALVVGQVREKNAATAAWTRPANEFTEWTGSFTTVQYSLVAQRYLHEYGADTLEGIAEASALVRNYGHLNPDAVFHGRGPFTAELVLASRMIASPLTLLMCSAVNDGGCAVVMTRADRARDTRKPPVRILAGGEQTPYPAYYEAPVLDAVPDDSLWVREALSRGGVRHDDVDVIEFYDHFAIGLVMELEMFGFCKRGEGAHMVRSGALRLDGRYPTCTDGGLQAYSHNGMPVLFRPIEAVRQLRGEVPDRCPRWQHGEHTHDPSRCRAARNPRVAFVSNPGPPTGGASFAVLARD